MKYTTSFIVFPKHCNHHKDLIFGGAFMAELDLVAAHCVRKVLVGNLYGIENAVTHKAEFEFKKPAYVGDFLNFQAEVTTVGKKSISIRVQVTRKFDEIIAIANFVFITVGEIKNLEHHPTYLPYKEHGLDKV